MEASNCSASEESSPLEINEIDNVSTLTLLGVLGRVLLSGIGFFIGCFLGLLVALFTGLIQFVGC